MDVLNIYIHLHPIARTRKLFKAPFHQAGSGQSSRGYLVPTAPTSASRKNLGVGLWSVFVLLLHVLVLSQNGKIGSFEAGFQRPSLSGGIVSRVSLCNDQLPTGSSEALHHSNASRRCANIGSIYRIIHVLLPSSGCTAKSATRSNGSSSSNIWSTTSQSSLYEQRRIIQASIPNALILEYGQYLYMSLNFVAAAIK